MSNGNFGDWKPMASAPKDGTRVLVSIRATEQGPGEVDIVRWTQVPHEEAEAWVSIDSDADCVIRYADVELACWMPLPSPLPRLRSPLDRAEAIRLTLPEDERSGSGI